MSDRLDAAFAAARYHLAEKDQRIQLLETAMVTVLVNLRRAPEKAAAIATFADAIIRGLSVQEAAEAAEKEGDPASVVEAAALSPQGLDAKEGATISARTVTIPAALAQEFALFADEWDRWQSQGSTSTERMVTFSYGKARIGLPQFRAVRDAFAATPSQRLDAATVERFREAIVTIIGRCEALEDEAADELAKEQPEHAAGFYRGQKTTAKSLRRHLADLARPITFATDPHQHGGKGV